MRKVKLSTASQPGSVLDIDRLVETRLLIQGGSGSGKSTLARRILEQTVGQLQQIVIDPEGEFSTLRKVGDYLLCAKDGDVPTDIKSASLLARRIRQTGVSAIIDIYELNALHRQAFTKAFLEGLIAAPKKYWRESLLFIDETHKFAPKSRSSICTEAVQDVADRGRKRKLCLICATHRQSKLHNDVIAELHNRMVGQTGLKNDLRSLADEMGLSYTEGRKALVDLSPGQFWSFGPAIAPEYTLFRASKTKTQAATADTQTVKASASLSKVIESLADLPMQAAKAAQTLADMKGEVVALKKQLRVADKPQSVNAIVPADVRKYDATVSRLRGAMETLMQFIIEINAKDFTAKIGDVDPDDIEKAIKSAMDQATKLIEAKLNDRNKAISAIQTEGRRIVNRIQRLVEKDDVKIAVSVTHNEPFTVTPAPPRIARGNGADTSAGLAKGERIVLIAIAQHDSGVDREQVTILTGYKTSTRNAYIQRLQVAGLIDIGPPIVATQDGIDVLPADFEPLPTGDDLRDYWLNKLPQGERAVLVPVIDVYPAGISRDQLSVETGYKTSTRNAYIQRLQTRKLVTVRGSEITAHDQLFK